MRSVAMTSVAPVRMPIRYKVVKFKDEWSYWVKFDFTFDYHEEGIKDFLLVEEGVYTFKTMNEANIQAKRICAEFKEYFAKGTYEEIVKALGESQCP